MLVSTVSGWWLLSRAEPLTAQGNAVLEACRVLGTGRLEAMVPMFKTVAIGLEYGRGERVRLVGVAAARARCTVLAREGGDAANTVRSRVSAVNSGAAVQQVLMTPPFHDLRDISSDLEASLASALNDSSLPRLETTLVVTVRGNDQTFDLPSESAYRLLLAVTGNLPTGLGWPP